MYFMYFIYIYIDSVALKNPDQYNHHQPSDVPFRCTSEGRSGDLGNSLDDMDDKAESAR